MSIFDKWKNKIPQLDKCQTFTYVEGCKTNTIGAPTLETRAFAMKHILKFIFGNSDNPAIIKTTDDIHTLGLKGVVMHFIAEIMNNTKATREQISCVDKKRHGS